MNSNVPPNPRAGAGHRAGYWAIVQGFFTRLVREGYLPLLIGALVLVLLGRYALTLHRNLAWRKPARLDNPLFGRPSDVVNGVVEWGSYALHSRRGAVSFEVDLEKPANVGRVRIYGRGDGFHMDSRAPIAVQYSPDGQTYLSGGTCGLVLTQVAPCEVDLAGASARYVRLAHPTHLVLSEVEVYSAR